MFSYHTHLPEAQNHQHVGLTYPPLLSPALTRYISRFNRSTPISQTTSSNPADHHTPLETGSSIPSHTTTNAGPTSTTPGSTGALGGATPSAASHSASSTGQHPASSSGTTGSSDAAAGLGSNPWEGKELPSAAAQHPDHANGGDVEGAGQEVGEDGLPVQHHAGKVGLGPNYKKVRRRTSRTLSF